MTPDEIQAMAKGLAEGQVVWYVLSAVIGGVITGGLAYLGEKSKNVATKEDIGAITHAVEATKEDFNRRLEDLKAHHQLRFVAADRRLQAHQDAYRLMMQIIRFIFVGGDKLDEVVEECQEWFYENCLYLGPKTRKAFRITLAVAPDHAGYVQERVESSVIKESWSKIIAPLDPIFEEVDLPPLSRLETDDLLEKLKK